jgi:hypothetical protein
MPRRRRRRRGPSKRNRMLRSSSNFALGGLAASVAGLAGVVAAPGIGPTLAVGAVSSILSRELIHKSNKLSFDANRGRVGKSHPFYGNQYVTVSARNKMSRTRRAGRATKGFLGRNKLALAMGTVAVGPGIAAMGFGAGVRGAAGVLGKMRNVNRSRAGVKFGSKMTVGIFKAAKKARVVGSSRTFTQLRLASGR